MGSLPPGVTGARGRRLVTSSLQAYLSLRAALGRGSGSGASSSCLSVSSSSSRVALHWALGAGPPVSRASPAMSWALVS